ncbi:jacalin-like lectin [Alicyclobacillus fastidiosus]|uniref:jacalin-like lectin n=1 Tax=Alicyclobacillus fastidiosus TaxID=392011 RepID=UPI0023E9281C|nr:hypothetical protein [Alicyclobacillus fastidiosus]GMA59715.1 hypothetical protein GCM10025859_01550 [Alicyclobacillus fastidiosus]GMA65564.1 hypothetical protein GCM10025859_60040 [Alicyclobacillus fastidiosus]
MEQVVESNLVTGRLNVANIFQGYNTFSDSGCLSALHGQYDDIGAVLTTQYRVVTDFESFTRAINLSASASVSYLGYSVSDKASFAQSLSLTTYSITVIAYGHKVSENRVARDVKWREGVEIPTPTTLNAFYQQYGDSFVSQIKRGAEYIGVYVFYAQSREEQQSIQNTLAAKGIYDGVTLSASLQSGLSEVQQSVQTRQRFAQVLYGFKSLKLPSPDNIASFLDGEFATREPDAPTVISYATSGYETALNTEVFKPIERTRRLFDGQFTSVTLAQVIAKMAYLKNQVEYIGRVYDTYGWNNENDSTYVNNAKIIESDWSELSSLITKIYDDPSQQYEIPDLQSLKFGVPELNFRINANEPYWGGSGGDAFQDVTYKSVLNQTRIARIVIRGGAYVDRLEVTYVDGNGKETTWWHGGEGGKPASPLTCNRVNVSRLFQVLPVSM